MRTPPEETMNSENGDQIPKCHQSRGRRDSKKNMLFRSQALRETPSPPREPVPNPCIPQANIQVPSAENASFSPPLCSNPIVVVSPSASYCGSPTRSTMCPSPASALVPSPKNLCSPQHSPSSLPCDVYDTVSPERTESDENMRFSTRVNGQNDRDSKRDNTSHVNNKRKTVCECTKSGCTNCFKLQEKNSNSINNNSTSNTLSVHRTSSRNKLRHQGSSQCSADGSASLSPSLSRESSVTDRYTDTTGTDLEPFFEETINKNAKDRQFLLNIEYELVRLAKDEIRDSHMFASMTSYQRMLVHRAAAFFGMDHNVDPSGKHVIVSKTDHTRIPEVEFKQHIRSDGAFTEDVPKKPVFMEDQPKKSILKRDSNSMDDYSFKSPERMGGMENRRSKSFEEREEEYARARRRIFNREVQSEDVGETLRPCVAKSYSFGGYGGISVLSRGDSIVSTHSAGPRLLTKQDSAASSMSWRLSPSSSGYKSQSQMSESVTPSPTSTPHPGNEQIITNEPQNKSDSHIVWAVTDIESVPKGSIIINPQTGEPIKNEDGSLYHYDPSDPPEILVPTRPVPASPQKSPPPPKPKEPQMSPKKLQGQPPKNKCSVTNSSTSPSLPYSPTPPTVLNQQRTYPLLTPNTESNAGLVNVQQQSYPLYGSAYVPPSPVTENAPTVYQQPCIVYTSNAYGMPMQQSFDGRGEVSQLPDMTGTYYVPENPGNSHAVSYPPPATFWSGQPMPFCQNTIPQAHMQQPRFSVAPSPQPGYMPATYPQSYIQQTAPPPPAPPPNGEMVPVYHNSSVPVVYSNPPPQPNVLYSSSQPPVVYTQNPIYQGAVYPPNLPQYGQPFMSNTGCSSSPGTSFSSQLLDQSQQNFVQLAQGVSQLTLGAQTVPVSHTFKPPQQQFDIKQKSFIVKNRFSNPKGIFTSSSRSSTGTNSPANTVISAYCPQSVPIYGTPAETPPNQFSYNQSFHYPPNVVRPLTTVRVGTPGTNKSSRSPTPASDTIYFDRQRIPLPPAAAYPTLPYVMHSDARVASGRSQPSTYRQMPQVGRQQGPSDNVRSHNKNKKSKGNKQQPGLPPSGK